MGSPIRSVCFIAYSFPPFEAGGTIRSRNFVKYLDRFGFRCHVLTVRPASSVIDEEKVKEAAGLPASAIIYRAFSLDPFRNKQSLLRGFRESKKMQFFQWLSAFFLIPDRQILWVPFAIWKGLQIIRRNSCNLIYSTFRPASNHLVALVLKTLTRKPWVADFRDPWIQNKNLICPTPLHRWLHQFLERSVIRSADRVIGVGDHIIQKLSDYEKEKGKFDIIPNGFDPELIARVQAVPHKAEAQCPFTLGYMGSFYKGRKPEALLRAAEELLLEKKVDASEFRIQFVSNFKGPLAPNSPLQNVVRLNGICAQEEALGIMNKATVLVLIIEKELKDQIVNAKVFEYMALGKPILALASREGAVAPYLERSGLGVFVSPDDVEEIKRKILDLYLQWKRGELRFVANIAFIQRFDVGRLSRRLAEIFDDLTSSSRDISSQLYTNPFDVREANLPR